MDTKNRMIGDNKEKGMISDKKLTHFDRAALIDGQYSLGLEGGIERITAGIARHRADAKEAAAVEWARLDGLKNSLLSKKANAEERAARLRLETNGEEPSRTVPIVWVIMGCVVAAGETIFLSPFFEALGIVTPIGQVVVAACVVMAWIILLHAVGHVAEAWGRPGRILGVCLLAVACIALAGIGWWRRDVIIASTHNSALRDFMTRSPTNTLMVLIVLTTILPLASAWIVWRYLPEACMASRWHRVMAMPQCCEETIQMTCASQRALGARLNMALERLSAEECEERERYLKYYRLGQRLNGSQASKSELPNANRWRKA